MSIINNKKELHRIFDLHQNAVKDNYKSTSIESFTNHYYDKLSSDNDDEMYIELSKSETISGRSEIIGW